MMRILGKISVAVLSTVVISFALALIDHASGKDWVGGSYYPSVQELTIVYALYAIPVYVFGGVPFSLAADVVLGRLSKFVKDAWLRYAVSFGVYLAGGLVVMGIFLRIFLGDAVFVDMSSTLSYFLGLGMAAALLFFHMELLLRFVWGRKREDASAD